MKNRILIDLDKEETIPQLTSFKGLIDVKMHGRIVIRNSILENIDTISEDELVYILKRFKHYISPIVTSSYIPDINRMLILSKIAPDLKIRFKTEKPGTNQIMPISSKEFFEGEQIFYGILKEIRKNWDELQKCKHLYNRIGQMLSYDLNTLTFSEFSNMHDQYSRNIFIAIVRNWGICASFAASYDYLCYKDKLESQVLSEQDHDYVMIETTNKGNLLTDPTADSVRLKFGMKSKFFGISKQRFIESGRKLEETEASECKFSELDDDELKQLDISTGYLDDFGGEYTDKYISGIGNNLQGKTNLEKIDCFFNRISGVKYVGRPSTYDFISIIKFILEQSKDRNFADNVNVYSFVSDHSMQMPRQIAIEVRERKDDKDIQYYVLKDGLSSFQIVEKIEDLGQYLER